MEPKKKLKLIPIWQFFKDMPLLNKLVFGLAFLALVGVSTWAWISTNNPVRWVIEVSEVSEASQDQVVLRTYAHNYRTMHTEIGAWKEDVVYVASRITPQAWLVMAFVVVQVLGWAYLLAAATYVRNVVAYAIFFAFAILIFLANSRASGSTALYWLTNAGLAVLVLGPAFLLQQEMLKLKFVARVLVFFLAASMPFALRYFNGGWLALHTATADMMLVLVVVAAVYIVFISNDLTNLIFYLATNARNPKHRVKFPLIFTVFLVLSAIEFVMLQKEMGWNLLSEGDDIALRPMQLLLVAAVIAVGTKQNMGPPLKSYIPNLPMSHGFVALGVICISFVAYMVSLGEYLFLHLVERFAMMLFFLTGIAHFFYVFYNFGPLIRGRINFYFLSMMPRRLMYFFVVIVAVAGTFTLEASSQGKSQRLLKETIYNRLGDDALLRGQNQEAMLHYAAAIYEARGSVKANYNLAMLELGLRGELTKAREHFKHASDFIPFPYAYLNWGNLEQSEYSPSQARFVLRQSTQRQANPYVSNNLAKAFLDTHEPDSAILEMKEALRMQPGNGAFYANLSRIYMNYDKVEEAKKFLEAGLALPQVHRATVTNALYLNLRHGTQIDVPETLLQQASIRNSWETSFNFAVDRYQRGDFMGAHHLLTHGQSDVQSYADSNAAISLRPDSLLLDGMLLFERGEIARAISRMDFIDVNFPSLRPFTNHFLGVAFFGAGLPEMAAAFFRKSVEYGRTSDLLAGAMMEFDRGNLEDAFLLLNLARGQDSTLGGMVNTEMAKLQFANGDYFFATLGFDAGTLTANDWMQVGIAAGKRGNKAAALEAFRHVIELDSMNTAPYLEMAKISLALGDSLAMDNLQPALERSPQDVALNVVHARILVQQGRLATAQAVVQNLQGRAPQDRSVRIVAAELAAARGDTASAIRELDQLRKESPVDPEVVLPLSHLYRAKRMDFEGQNMVMEAKNINPENPDFWYEIAHFERLLVRPEEAGANALEAMKRVTSLERSREIAEEFKEEIATFKTQHPDDEEYDNGN